MAGCTKTFYVVLVVASLMASTNCEDSKSQEKLNGDLKLAARKGDLGALKSLLGDGADINSQIGPDKQTPVMAASLAGQAGAVKFLLKRNADTTIAEKDGYTPMHGAGFQGRAEVAEALIDHGLDPKDLHTDGFMAFHRACWGNSGRHANTVKVMVQQGNVPVDEPAKDDLTCLIQAAAHGNVQTVKMLLTELAADPNAVDKEGQTAMHKVFMGRTKVDVRNQVLTLLLENGGDLSIKDNKGETVVDIAKKQNMYEKLPALSKRPKEQRDDL